MKAYRALGGGLLVAFVGLLIWAVVGGSSDTPRRFTTPVVIDPAVGETFAPAPPSARPLLTSDEAWARYAKLNGDKGIHPQGHTTVYVGLLTLPINRQRTRF